MINNQLNIDNIGKCVSENKVDWTKHCLNKLQQRNIKIAEVKIAINNGRIIEYYYDDYPYPSCLIFGYTTNNRIIHVVCGISDDFVHMITAYYPDSIKWKED